jgi:signal transduction histidine kinase
VLSLATACLAGAAGIKAATLYAVSTSILFAAVRHSQSGGSASLNVAAEDAAYAAMIGIAVAVAIEAIRLGAHRADTAEAHAIAAYRESAGARAQLIERHRLGAILHDSVMTALVSAAQAVTPEQRRGAAEAARDGIRRLEEYAATEPARSPVPLLEVPSRLQAVAESPAFLPVDIFSALPDDSTLTLPARASDALLEATFTALDNASRHSGASRATVSVRVVGGRLRIEVADDGRGFEPASVPQRRLGIRLSIIQRVVDAGGRANVASAPGLGTTVTLEWEVDES